MSLTFPSVVTPDAVAAGETLLAQVVAGMTELGNSLPDRRGMVPGDVVPWDCDQLVLNFMGISRGAVANPDQTQIYAMLPQETILVYEFRVTLLRQVATITGKGNPPKLPSMAAMTADYETIAGDARDLAMTLAAIHASFTMVPVGVLFGWGPVAPVGPEGALAGVVSPVRFMAGRNPQGGF